MNNSASPTLREQGMRFVFRNGRGQWMHPLDVDFHDVDCTDMTDEEFAAFIHSRGRPVSSGSIEVGDSFEVPSFSELCSRGVA